MPDLERSRLRRVGVALVCAKVALVPLALDAASDWSFVVPKALLGHALGYAIVAVLLALFVRFGRSVLPLSPLHVPVLAFLAAEVLATALAVDRFVALFGTHERMLGLATIADWVVLYFAVVAFVRTRSDAYVIALSAFAASVVVLGYELLQVTGRDPISWTIAGADRAFSTIGQPTSLGQYASTLAVASFALGLLAPGLGRGTRVALMVLAAALIWGTSATDSRAPIVGLAAAAFVLVVAVWLTRRGTRDARIAALAGVAAVGALAALLLLTPIGARVAFTIQAARAGDDSIFARVDESTAGRIALYQIGIGELLERPLTGYGPDNFVVGVPRYRPEPAPYAIRQSAATSAHSWLIQTAATAGVLGLATLLACFVVATVLVVRSGFQPVPLAAAAALAAHLGTGLTTVDDLAAGWIPWFCLGAIAAGTVARSETEETPVRGSARRKSGKRAAPREPQARRTAAVILAAVGLIAMATPMAAYSASRDAKTSADTRLVGRTADALQTALAATRSDPRRAEYWHTLALAYFAAQRLTDARTAFDRANSLAPYLAGYTGDLIQIELALAQRGDAAARARAIDLANALAARDAKNPRSHISRATVMLATGDIPEATRSIERALALDTGSTNENLYLVASQIFLAAARPRDAVDVARRGIATIGAAETLKQLRDALDRALVALGLPPDPRPDPGACTSTLWRATPVGPQPAGTRVSFAVDVTGCQRQESQIAVVPKSGGESVYLSSGVWAASHVWDTTGLSPGTYRVSLYTRRAGWTGPYQAFYEGEYVLSR